MAAFHQKKSGKRKPLSKPPKRHVLPLDKAKAHEVIWPKVSEVFGMARRFKGMSFVYFIGEVDDGPVKIGLAKDPIGRLRNMQVGNPRRLRVERVLVGDMRLEKLLHEMWLPMAIPTPASRRKPDAPPGTEWFEPEIRERLFPIIDTAAQSQVEFLMDVDRDITSEEIEQFVRDAHIEHDFVVHARHQTQWLAAGAGYVADRVSRI